LCQDCAEHLPRWRRSRSRACRAGCCSARAGRPSRARS
jgi:hypothetical protein